MSVATLSNRIDGTTSGNGRQGMDLEEWQLEIIKERDDGSIGLSFIYHREKVNDDAVLNILSNEKVVSRKVTRINLQDCNGIMDVAATTIAKHCKDLEELYLDGCRNLTDNGIVAMINGNPKLKYLYFSRCYKVTDASMEAVVKGCPDLVRLYANGVGLTSLPEDMFLRLTKLKALELEDNNLTKLPKSISELANCLLLLNGNPLLQDPNREVDRINKSVTSILLEELIISPGIIRLNFSDCRKHTTDKIVEEILTKCGKVTYIELSGCVKITDDAARSIARHCKDVKEIDIDGCCNLTDEGIIAIINSNPQLEELYFRDCNKVTDKSIKALVRGCPNLERLDARDVGLTSLPEDMFEHLTKFKYLSLKDNNLVKLPNSITKLSKECELYLDGNPLQDPPISIALKEGIDGIVRYREDLVKYGAVISKTLKTVFVGDGEAGKTSLLYLIRGDEEPMTEQSKRTIHLDCLDVSIEVGDNSIILACYDCGGQKQYVLGQTAFLTSSALYFLCVNAEESNMQRFLRFLVTLQARAPGAVVQIILTKIDLVENPDKKKIEVQKAVNKFIKDCRSHRRGWKHHLLRIQNEIIMTSLTKQDTLDLTRNKIIKKIADLTSIRPPLFPTLGQKTPKSWLTCRDFLDKLRDMGCDGDERIFIKAYSQALKNHDLSPGDALQQNTSDILSFGGQQANTYQNISPREEVAKSPQNNYPSSSGGNFTDKGRNFTYELNCQALLIVLCCSLFILCRFEVASGDCDSTARSHFDNFDSKWMAFGLIIPQGKDKEDSVMNESTDRVSRLTLIFSVLGVGMIGCLLNKSFNHRHTITGEEIAVVLEGDESSDYKPSMNDHDEDKNENLSSIHCPYMARSKMLELWRIFCNQHRRQTDSSLRLTNL